jgi:hypothetical protein
MSHKLGVPKSTEFRYFRENHSITTDRLTSPFLSNFGKTAGIAAQQY